MVQLLLQSELWKHSTCLIQAIDRSSVYANSSKFLAVVQELIKRCLLKHPETLMDMNAYEAEIRTAAANIVANSTVLVMVGNTGAHCDLAKSNSTGTAINLSGDWMARVQYICEYGGEKELQCRKHMCLLIVKLLSALCQSFTTSILSAEHHIRLTAAANNPTVPTINTDMASSKIDLGAWAEEILSGCDVRFHFANSPFRGPPWDFQEILLFQWDPEHSSNVKKRKAVDIRSFVARVAASEPQDLSDSHLELQPYQQPREVCQCTRTKLCARHAADATQNSDDSSSSDSDERDAWEFVVGFAPTRSMLAPRGGLAEALYLARTAPSRPSAVKS